MAAPSVAAPMSAAQSRGRSRYTRLAAMGLALMSAASLVLLLVGLAVGIAFADSGPFLLSTAVVAAVAAALVWRFGWWAKVVGLVATLGVAAMTFWMAFGLFAPGSMADFTAGVLFVVGFLSSVGGNIAGLVRRNVVDEQTARGERALLRVAGAVVAVGIVAAAVVSVTGRTTVTAEEAAGAAPVTMAAFEFAEDQVTVPAGQESQLLVHNRDGFLHDVTIDVLNVGPVAVSPGSETLVTLTAPAGEYELYCSIHPEMTAQLIAE